MRGTIIYLFKKNTVYILSMLHWYCTIELYKIFRKNIYKSKDMKKHKKNSHFNSLESLNYLSKFPLLTPKSTSKFTWNDFVLCYCLFFFQKYIVSIVSACIYPLLLTNVGKESASANFYDVIIKIFHLVLCRVIIG